MIVAGMGVGGCCFVGVGRPCGCWIAAEWLVDGWQMVGGLLRNSWWMVG